jgi:hypothetical protein
VPAWGSRLTDEQAAKVRENRAIPKYFSFIMMGSLLSKVKELYPKQGRSNVKKYEIHRPQIAGIASIQRRIGEDTEGFARNGQR